jgi:hypothetical protein
VRRIAIGAVILSAGDAAATESVRLDWVRGEGADACPDGTEIARRVQARLGRSVLSDDARRRIEGVVERRGAGWRVTLRVRDADGTVVGRREIDASSADCEPVADAAVLAVALAIDPEAALGPPPPAEAVEPPAPAPASPAPPPETCRAAEPIVLTAPVYPGLVVRPCPEPPEPSYRLTASARALAAGGQLPRIAPGAALAADVRFEERWHVGAELFWLPETLAPTGPFAFGLTAGAAQGCFDVVPFGRGALGVCLGVQIGALHAVVLDLVPIEPGEQLWAAAAAHSRLDVALAEPLGAEVGIELGIPMVRHEFGVAGRPDPAFITGTVTGRGFVGLTLFGP